jgi:acyl-CoA synthetase (AMP-forming)/AMP-acid ligase II
MTMLDQSAAWRSQREQAFAIQAPPSLGALLERAARDHGNATAIDLFERGTRLSFAEWDDKSRRLASGLRDLGIERGMHVGVLLENVVEFPVTWLALARMGAVMVPINPRYTPTELNYVITDAQIGHLVIGLESVEKIDEVRQHWPQTAPDTVMVVGDDKLPRGYTGWNTVLEIGSPDFVPSHRVKQSDLASIQYTSGTTGFPKGCMQSHRFWLVCGFNQHVMPEVFSTGSILGESPFFYLDALLMTARSLFQGVALFQAERMSLRKHHGRLIDTQCECAFSPVLGDEPGPEEREHNIKMFICVAGSPQENAEIERRYGAPVRELYGMTEIGIALGVPYRVDDPAIIGTCGVPYPLYEAKVVDEAGQTCPSEAPGELWIRGPGIMEGYWNKPEANARSFSDGWFRTGDIFTRTKGGHFRYVGRFKDMIKRSGENISAVEVETVTRQFPGIEEVAVIPVKHRLRGEEVKAFITLHPKASVAGFDYVALHAHCTEHLALFKIPRYVEIIEAFDHTPSAKIKKNDLITNNRLAGNWDYTIGAPVEG